MTDRRSSSFSTLFGEDIDFQPRPTVLRCSFCGLGEGEVARLFEGRNNNYICNECVDVSVQLLADYRELGLRPPLIRVPWYKRMLRSETAKTGHCSFCGLPQADGERLFASPEVQICERCVRACEVIRSGSQYGM